MKLDREFLIDLGIVLVAAFVGFCIGYVAVGGLDG